MYGNGWGPLTKEAYVLRRRLWREQRRRRWRDERLPRVWARAWNRFSRRLAAGR